MIVLNNIILNINKKKRKNEYKNKNLKVNQKVFYITQSLLTKKMKDNRFKAKTIFLCLFFPFFTFLSLSLTYVIRSTLSIYKTSINQSKWLLCVTN